MKMNVICAIKKRLFIVNESTYGDQEGDHDREFFPLLFSLPIRDQRTIVKLSNQQHRKKMKEGIQKKL